MSSEEDVFKKLMREAGMEDIMIPSDPLNPRPPIQWSDIKPDAEVLGTPPALDDGLPRLWDRKPEGGVTHIAGSQMQLFGIFLRQRCDWCGIILIEYDLRRVSVPVGQDHLPSMYPAGSLVRVDEHVSAVIENPEIIDGGTQLPPDSCAFDPRTQVGASY